MSLEAITYRYPVILIAACCHWLEARFSLLGALMLEQCQVSLYIYKTQSRVRLVLMRGEMQWAYKKRVGH